MKKILLVLIILCILYFILGFIAVKLDWFKWLTQDIYSFGATIVGGLASVFCLIAFIQPRLTTSDIQTLEVKFLKNVAETAEELSERQKELSTKEKEIMNLEIKKQEMEFLVKKASLSLFLQDQIERNEKRVLDFIDENKEISELLVEIKSLKEKMSALKEEIKSSENVDLLMEVIESARETKKERNLKVEFVTPFGSLFTAIDDLAKIIVYGTRKRN